MTARLAAIVRLWLSLHPAVGGLTLAVAIVGVVAGLAVPVRSKTIFGRVTGYGYGGSRHEPSGPWVAVDLNGIPLHISWSELPTCPKGNLITVTQHIGLVFWHYSADPRSCRSPNSRPDG
jgi:hypothetical protein